MPQYYYNKPKVQPINTYYNSYNYYVASTMNSQVGVASHDDSSYTTSTNIYSTNDLHHISYNSRYYSIEGL